MDKRDYEEEIDVTIKTPKKAFTVKELLATGKVIRTEVSKDGKVLLDRNNPDHVRIWED